MDVSPQSVNDLIWQLSTLRQQMLGLAEQTLPDDHLIDPAYTDSAPNLLHYLALRQHDLRPLQAQLTHLGLSSMGQAESHVLATVNAVLARLHQLNNSTDPLAQFQSTAPDFLAGPRRLDEHTTALLGEKPMDRACRIMVTMPAQAADDYPLMHALLEQGMDCMRINCAHDDASVWARLIEQLRQAEKALNRSCKVLMDLAGPKLRTGPLPAGPAVLKVKPRRDESGRVRVPARLWLTSHPVFWPTSAAGQLRLPAGWLKHLKVSDRIHFTDARHSARTLHVTDVTPQGCWAELKKTAYFENGTRLHRTKKQVASVSNIPPTETSLRLHEGDTLVLMRQPKPGAPVQLDHRGEVLRPAFIGCRLPDALANVQVGHHVWFDDGKIEGIVRELDAQQLVVQITQAKPKGSKLRADKGINLPDSEITLSAPTPDDTRDLAFVAQWADIVALSFVNSTQDVDALCAQIRQLGERQPAIVLKIETQTGFNQLPNLLLNLMQWPVGGIMLARGDLAVECGFERLSEVQEEIMWLCQAAHLPVIWATQVLEGLAKTGLPSRAEITDAAMGHRAECVMLNKGPYIVRTVQMLTGILRRMQAHQAKKNDLLRELQVAHSVALKS